MAIKRIFILSGQGGKLSSAPFEAELSNRLSKYGMVTTHVWRDPDVPDLINTTAARVKIAVAGYSLGANQLGWISGWARRPIELGVAYDPSKQSPLVRWDQSVRAYVQSAPNFQKLICFYRPLAWVFGGSRYVGPNVTTYQIHALHLLVQTLGNLHDITEKAVRDM